MGLALARAFAKAGHQTTVWNRTPGKAGDLNEAGSVAEAVAASDLVIVCVLDYVAVEEVLKNGTIAGRTVVNLTNGTPRQARELAAWVDEQKARYVDGGIMAVPGMIGQPGSTLVYSGSRYAYDLYEPALSLLGSGTFVGEDPGLAALYDLSLLSAMYGLHGGALNAFALAGSEKVPARDFLTLLQPWLRAMLGMLPRFAEQIDSGDYRSGVSSKLEMQLAAFPNFFNASKDQGVRADFLVPMYELMKERVAAGHGDEDGAGIVEILKERVG
jgi:3-hydroxyisobutyrate dehydrogenase-like beta-hydroxyacid dehydrogenase